MEDCYYEGLADDVLLADDDLFQREVIKGDDALLLTDAFLSEVFRKSMEKPPKFGRLTQCNL